MATVLAAGAVPTAEAHYDVTIGTTNTAGDWRDNVWTPSGEGSTVSASSIDGLINFSDSGLYDYFGEGNMFALSYNSETGHPTNTVWPREGSDLTSAQMKQQVSYVIPG